MSDTFAGIRPADAPGFIAAQMIGAFLGLYVGRTLFGLPRRVSQVGEGGEVVIQQKGQRVV